MKVPKRLQPLVDDGLVDEILSQLMSGKEAQVYVVRCGSAIRCAKVYKAANQRSFKQAVQYQEGRKVRNTRQARAMGKRSRYGQKKGCHRYRYPRSPKRCGPVWTNGEQAS